MIKVTAVSVAATAATVAAVEGSKSMLLKNRVGSDLSLLQDSSYDLESNKKDSSANVVSAVQ